MNKNIFINEEVSLYILYLCKNIYYLCKQLHNTYEKFKNKLKKYDRL